MKFIDLFRLAYSNLWGNKLRTILTIVGVGIGIGAIVFLVSLGFGLQELTVNRLTSSAALSTIDVLPPKSEILKLNDEAIEVFKSIEGVEGTSSQISISGQIMINDASTEIKLNGVEANFLEFENLKIKTDERNLAEGKNGVILSEGTLKRFSMENNQVLGKTLRITAFIDSNEQIGALARKEIDAEVISVIEGKSPMAYLDISTFRSFGINDFNLVKVKIKDITKINDIKQIISNKGYPVKAMADLVQQIASIFRIIQMVLGGFGIIALIVASIGMFNTMTIALLERTRDIGIMKAIGARDKDIRRIFLVESIVISITGGALGIGGALGLGVILNIVVNMLSNRVGGEAVDLFLMPLNFMLFVIGFSLLTGILTGIYPARRAAKLNPLDALRYE